MLFVNIKREGKKKKLANGNSQAIHDRIAGLL